MVRKRSKPKTSPTLAVAYCRVSTSDQAHGLSAQRESIERWAAANSVTVVSWSVDNGVSGAAQLDERPALLEALGALREHGAGVLVAAKRDRLARDVSSAAAIERLAAEAGARVSTSDGIDSSDTPEGQLLRTLIDAMAQYERALIRARTKAALRVKHSRGERIGGVPYGLEVAADGRTLVPSPDEQRVLERIRTMRASGSSYTTIAATLNRLGTPARGKRWHATTIQRALARVKLDPPTNAREPEPPPAPAPLEWRLSDGTVVRLGGEIEGESKFATLLRKDLSLVPYGRVNVTIGVQPGAARLPLDPHDATHVDVWLREHVRFNPGVSIVSRPAFPPVEPDPNYVPGRVY